jgi:UDP-2-acetamido-3-amino-2,3-dideoxy-glucuronate N-acetyltransferase
VTRDVPDYAHVRVNPARLAGWVCECGVKLPALTVDTVLACGDCGIQYRAADNRIVGKLSD